MLKDALEDFVAEWDRYHWDTIYHSAIPAWGNANSSILVRGSESRFVRTDELGEFRVQGLGCRQSS